MFADLMDKEIQPQSIDTRHLQEIDISDKLRTDIQEMFENEEGNFVKVYKKTSIVQNPQKNFVFFSNQWFYLATLCKKYAEALKEYGDFFDKKIRGSSDEVMYAFGTQNKDNPELMELIPDAIDRERMMMYVVGDSDFRPGKSLVNFDSKKNKYKPRAVKDMFG